MKANSKISVAIIVFLASIFVALFGMTYNISSADYSMYALTSAGLHQTQIQLEKDRVSVIGGGANAWDTTVTITQGGTYCINGILDNGQIYVDAGSKGVVVLSLNGADISNVSDAAIYVKRAKQTILVLESGTNNRVTSGTQADRSSTEDDGDVSGGAIYARNDLVVTGDGTLQVFGYINNGIHSTDNLTIDSGNIEIEAKNNGLKGTDSVTITGGNFVIAAGGNGIQSKSELAIEGGEIQITESYEGIEANQVRISGGSLSITARDDGINASGEDLENMEEIPNIYISGANIVIDAECDGIDSNGSIYVESGSVIINGPTGDSDGALDYGAENGGICRVNGGTVFGIASSGMPETFDDGSEQCAFLLFFPSFLTVGSEIVIADDEGNILFRHIVVKPADSVVFSSPELKLGEIYHITADGQTIDIEQNLVSVVSE